MAEIGRSEPPWSEQVHTSRSACTHTQWAIDALSRRAAEWSSDSVLDPGDSHDKGESFCVGEAA